MTQSAASPKGRIKRLRPAAVASLLLLLPFVVLELVNRREFNEGFPFLLFVLLWALPVAFAAVTASTIQTFGSGKRQAGGVLIVRLMLLGLIAWAWISILTDQMPCFLGIPNCD